VRLYRKLIESPIWTNLGASGLKFAIYFLLRANWRDTDWYDGRRRVVIPRGSFVTSYEAASNDCQLTVKQARNAFAHLARIGFATYTHGRHWTMVAITNYDQYQSEIEPEGRAGTRAGSFDETGQPQLTKQGRQKGNLNSLVSSVDSTDTSADLETGQAQGQAPSMKQGRTRASTRAGRRATDKEIKNIRINTYASDDAQRGSLPETTPRQKPSQDALGEIARNIHGRHPNSAGAAGRRDLSDSGVAKALTAILKHKHVSSDDCEPYLRTIDENHASWCDSEAWRKEGGQFVKSLSGWLAPTKERYDVAPDTHSQQINGHWQPNLTEMPTHMNPGLVGGEW
jgi:hypothetical protein